MPANIQNNTLIEIFAYKGEPKYRMGEIMKITDTGDDQMIMVRVFQPADFKEKDMLRNFFVSKLVASY